MNPSPTLKTDGKFFRLGSERFWLRCVTYGPFPPDGKISHRKELEKIRSANFNAIRVFSLPDQPMLDAAAEAGLLVFAGLDWRQYEDFISRPHLFSSAIIRLSEWLNAHAHHPALAGVYVGNEIPSDLVRWMGPDHIRQSLENLIHIGRGIAPHVLFAYANYPSTEYLELENADFTAFNIYLENADAFVSYVRRLHNIAGDRPLVISEFGLDSVRNPPEAQAETFSWGLKHAYAEETAGFTVYAWSDLWFNAGMEVTDWSFGITDRQGNQKPAFEICRDFQPVTPSTTQQTYTIIVCTRNGAPRISSCLHAIDALAGGPYETIVVDDGSTDQTAEIVSKTFPHMRLLSIPPSGLSAARNLGAEAASGQIFVYTDDDCVPDFEWISRLDRAFQNPEIAAAGGPNLPPKARSAEEAIISAAPGAPSHVLLDDTRAEHLPGCNIAVRREAFETIGGFNPAFRTAGDDVDFCWRLRDAGYELGFASGAFVWHHRRPSIMGFLKQQIGYGHAERILLTIHPNRFSKNGETRWDGFVYVGGVIRVGHDSLIYHGPMGQAGYQSITNRMLPMRPLDDRFRNASTSLLLKIVSFLQPQIRSWTRNRRIRLPKISPETSTPLEEPNDFTLPASTHKDRNHILDHLLADGWKAAGDCDAWDLEKQGTRLLLATERLDHQHLNHLIRIWGNPQPVMNDLIRFLNQS
ncbi:MAG: glycosyltransferase [Verrucomicrobiota bacterium]